MLYHVYIKQALAWMARFISLSNARQHNTEYSNVALGIYKAGASVDGQIHTAVKYSAARQRLQQCCTGHV